MNDHIVIGTASSAWFQKDPRAMAYTAAKYATVAKLLQGYESVLEIGCGDGFGLPILRQAVGRVVGIDIDPDRARQAGGFVQDFTSDPMLYSFFDAAVALDVLEHIQPEKETDFLSNVRASLKPTGIFINGMPTLNAQAYASDYAKDGHINCQHPEQITETLRRHFRHVFSFGLTDGHITTGFEPCRQYQLNVCTGPK